MLKATIDLKSNVNSKMEAGYKLIFDKLRARYPDTIILVGVESAPQQAASLAKRVILERRDPKLLFLSTVRTSRLCHEGIIMTKDKKEKIYNMLGMMLATMTLRVSSSCIYYTDTPMTIKSKVYPDSQRYLDQLLRRQMINMTKTDKGITGKIDGMNDDVVSALVISISNPNEVIAKNVWPAPLYSLNGYDEDFTVFQSQPWDRVLNGHRDAQFLSSLNINANQLA